MIFVIGTQKSGTTWLGYCIAHVCAVPKNQEWYFVELHKRITQYISTYGHLSEQQRIITTHKVAAAAWKLMLDTVTPSTVFDKSAYSCTKTFMPVRNDLLHPLIVQHSHDVSPDSHTIVIVRDPRAVVNSAIHYLDYFRAGWWHEIDPSEFGIRTRTVNGHAWIFSGRRLVSRYA